MVRNNRAFYNGAGVENENNTSVKIYENDIYENTSGLLIFNLPKLTLYVRNITAYNNRIYNNNIENFDVK